MHALPPSRAHVNCTDTRMWQEVQRLTKVMTKVGLGEQAIRRFTDFIARRVDGDTVRQVWPRTCLVSLSVPIPILARKPADPVALVQERQNLGDAWCCLGVKRRHHLRGPRESGWRGVCPCVCARMWMRACGARARGRACVCEGSPGTPLPCCLRAQGPSGCTRIASIIYVHAYCALASHGFLAVLSALAVWLSGCPLCACCCVGR